MHYYIDGYNLLFRILKAGDEVRKQREEITLELEKKIRILDLDVTLVFDSHYQEGESTRSHFKSLEIIFTAQHETADEFILHELKNSKSPSQQMVVTSDKQLARLCKLRLAQTQSVEEFFSFLEKRYKNKLRQKRLEAKTPSLVTPFFEGLKKIDPSLIHSPIQKDSAKGCFDFYLDAFNKEFESIERQRSSLKKNPNPTVKKIKKQVKTKDVKENLSNYDRWLKAFENEKDDKDNGI